MDKKKYEPITEEEKEIFRDAMRGIAPKKNDKVAFRKKPTPLKKRLTIEDTPPGRYLSDHSNEADVASDQTLFFAKSGLSPGIIKKLKSGKLPIEATLDLHGYDVESARQTLVQFIESASHNHKRCVRIVHGKGHSDLPVLKNKINIWLRQFDTVLAFCSATLRAGGSGAVYVLLKR